MTTQLPSVRSTVAWTKLPDGAVLFSPETEAYYAMNGVAALVPRLAFEVRNPRVKSSRIARLRLSNHECNQKVSN